ncbi:nucleobase:cation symporter-1, NCS1 family [Galdieria sulphuraria]|uniref:Nucleobase:cation symporter-1, NCS1 family n=1 Tax=Galdieria sulphuraria TaxID=130081 RepID=M2W0L7_GALSU|nr:nucleobase:cation symporter-1, NCS1 family [Galdieria sulphuraria]EME29151.1 nucleobase:cation symporter-1, NCS1 family [Galdieria sulphuraria]|eukprot:XP_005705671.1 nucleobase:cation symporter-1, NCS1 family [Galdieria sulphuraria]
MKNTRKRLFCRNCQSAYCLPLNRLAKREYKRYQMKSDFDAVNQNLTGNEFPKSSLDGVSTWKPVGESSTHNDNTRPSPVSSNPSEEAPTSYDTSSVNQLSSFDGLVESVSKKVPDWLYKPAIARDFPRPRVPSSPELIHRYEQRRKFFSAYPGRAVLVCIGALITLATPSRAPTFLTIPVQFVALSMIALHVILLFIWLFGVNGAAAHIYTPTEEEYNKIKDNLATPETMPILPAERRNEFALYFLHLLGH